MSHPPAEPPPIRPQGTEPAPHLQPRVTSPDSFEQNPLNTVAERVSLKATEGLDDAGRVREAMRIVIAEGVSINEAARRCHVAPSFLAAWREKYLELISEDQSIAQQPLMEKGAVLKDADLITIPKAARDQFAENWERLVRITQASPSTFHQSPVRLFLENSWMTSWFFSEGRLDRGVFAGAVVGMVAIVVTASFLMAGHFYRPDEKPAPRQLNYDDAIQLAGSVAHQFFAAPTAEEKLKYVRLTEGARPGFDEYFRKFPAFSITDATLSKAIPDNSFYLLELDVPSLRRAHQCIVFERDGKMLVDWETSSWFQEANLEELRKNLTRTPVRIAVRVVLDTYYNFGFTEKEYSSYRLSYPGVIMDFFGYTKRGSAEDSQLQELLEPLSGATARQISAILEVRYPQGAAIATNQLQIVRIISKDWVGR